MPQHAHDVPPLPLEIGTAGVYEGMDKNQNWWKVTILAENSDGTYQAQVHDGTSRVWPVVYIHRIRKAGPRPPVPVPDVVWHKANGLLVLSQASEQHKIQLERGPEGRGIVVTAHRPGDHPPLPAFTKAKKVVPEQSRAYVLLSAKGSDEQFKIVMPTPQHAIYPLMRILFDSAGVSHNLGPELPGTIEAWERHTTTGRGLIYWHNTDTKGNSWKEPPEEATEAAFEKQLQKALAESVANGMPRDKAETEAEKRVLRQKLQEAGLAEVAVGDDGNCQFRAIAHVVMDNNEEHLQVRKAVVDYVKQNKDVYINFVDEDLGEYCKTMANGNRWGDHVTLVAAANLYNIKFEVISSTDIGAAKIILPRYARRQTHAHAFHTHTHLYAHTQRCGGRDLCTKIRSRFVLLGRTQCTALQPLLQGGGFDRRLGEDGTAEDRGESQGCCSGCTITPLLSPPICPLKNRDLGLWRKRFTSPIPFEGFPPSPSNPRFPPFAGGDSGIVHFCYDYKKKKKKGPSLAFLDTCARYTAVQLTGKHRLRENKVNEPADEVVPTLSPLPPSPDDTFSCQEEHTIVFSFPLTNTLI